MGLVVFDCDGTLVDSQHAIVEAMQAAFADVGLGPPSRSETLSIVGLSLPEAFAELAPAQPPLVRLALADAYRAAFAEARLRDAHGEPLYPGAREVVEALARRGDLALGIATGKSRRGVTRLLERERWSKHFTTIQTADDHPSKPDPSMLLQAMSETGMDRARTVMIGDTAFDMGMAMRAGVYAIGVTWGYHPAALLRSAGADVIVGTYAETLAVVERKLPARKALR